MKEAVMCLVGSMFYCVCNSCGKLPLALLIQNII